MVKQFNSTKCFEAPSLYRDGLRTSFGGQADRNGIAHDETFYVVPPSASSRKEGPADDVEPVAKFYTEPENNPFAPHVHTADGERKPMRIVDSVQAAFLTHKVDGERGSWKELVIDTLVGEKEWYRSGDGWGGSRSGLGCGGGEGSGTPETELQ